MKFNSTVQSRFPLIFSLGGILTALILFGVPLEAVAQMGFKAECGEEIYPLELYDRISYYSLILAFAFILPAILIGKKPVKMALGALGVLILCGWGYINFGVDYDRINRTIFNYNVRAEQTLANMAEAQDRFKSEHDTFLKDLQELESHLAGAHGLDECVEILELNVTWDHWSAVAQHVNSPESVKWDSTSGSSLKKG